MKTIKLHPELIAELLNNFRYEVATEEDLTGDWELDEDFYHEQKQAFKLHNTNDVFIELPNNAFIKSIKYTLSKK